MSTMPRVAYSRDEFMALMDQSHTANLPAHLTNPDYLTSEGKFAPDKYVEGVWKLERTTRKRTDIPDAFQNGSTLSPQRRGFSDGETSLRRRALNNNLPTAPASQISKPRTKTNGVKLTSSTLGKKPMGKKDDKFGHSEELPEWMDEGPTDHTEVIPLGGFDDEKPQRKPNRKLVLELSNAQEKKDSAPLPLPDSDLEFAAQFGLLDIISAEPKKAETVNGPPQSRLSRFFADKSEAANSDESLKISPAVAMLLQGGSKSMSAAPKIDSSAQVLDEQAILSQQRPKPVPEDAYMEDDLEEFKKIILDDYETLERPHAPAPPAPKEPNTFMQPEQQDPSVSTQQPPILPSQPGQPQMGVRFPPTFFHPAYPGFPFLHPIFLQEFQNGVASGRINPADPVHEQMARHVKMQLALMAGVPPNPLASAAPQENRAAASSSNRSSPTSSKVKPAFDLVPTAVMLQRSTMSKDENESRCSSNNDKPKTVPNSSIAQPKTPPTSSAQHDAPQVAGMPSVIPPPFMNVPFGPPGFAQMGTRVFPIPNGAAFAMDSKRLQEAQQRGDTAMAAFFQNRLQTQMQALACLQQQHQTLQSLARSGELQFPPANGPVSLVQCSGASTPQSNPDPLRPNREPTIPTVLQTLNQLGEQHQSQGNLNILNKLPPHVRPMTVEELERQLASS